MSSGLHFCFGTSLPRPISHVPDQDIQHSNDVDRSGPALVQSSSRAGQYPPNTTFCQTSSCLAMLGLGRAGNTDPSLQRIPQWGYFTNLTLFSSLALLLCVRILPHKPKKEYPTSDGLYQPPSEEHLDTFSEASSRRLRASRTRGLTLLPPLVVFSHTLLESSICFTAWRHGKHTAWTQGRETSRCGRPLLSYLLRTLLSSMTLAARGAGHVGSTKRNSLRHVPYGLSSSTNVNNHGW